MPVAEGGSAMIALFFEVTPKPGQDDRYLEIAASLRPVLDASGGCLFLERYRSLTRPRTMLSHQIWADEASLARWRANARHYGAQTAGRTQVFDDYRLRVGAVAAEAKPGGPAAAVDTGLAYNDPARVPERWMVVVRSAETAFDGGSDGEAFRSVYDASRHAWVGAVPDRARGLALLARAAGDSRVHVAQLCLVSRDYGLLDRAEAPQYFPPVQ
jgi:heme-degrading monooxygenase HmoA